MFAEAMWAMVEERDAEIERLRAALDNERTNAEDLRQNCSRVVAENERLKAALGDARQALNLALLADGLQNDIKARLRTAWLKVGDALTLRRAAEQKTDTDLTR